MTTAVIEKQEVKVGDIFYTSWGYDQTNVDFFRVIRTSKASIWVQETGQNTYGLHARDYWTTVSDGEPLVREFRDYDTGEVTKTVAPIKVHRIQYDSQGLPCFTINSYSSAYLWDGTPKHASDGA